MSNPSVVIVSPALAAANNGNWQTARRWRQLLAQHATVRIVQLWPDARAAEDEVMLALHAQRSAPSIAAWHAQRGPRGLAVVLTGTDLYGGVNADSVGRLSLQRARALVVLQDLGVDALPAALHGKTRVIYQSCTERQALAKTARLLRATMVGHLRAVKSPQTLFDAACLLAGRTDIRIEHIGGASEPALGEAAVATQRECTGYRWLGALPHNAARTHIQRAHVLVHTSAAEGGAHVLMEAMRSGTPVLASRIPGNVGMLGVDYDGYFPTGDANALARLLVQCRAGQQGQTGAPGLLEQLRSQCALRAPLFAPQAERALLATLVNDLMERP